MLDLSYRDLGPADFDAVHATASHWDVVRQLGSWPWPADPAFTHTRCVPFAGHGFVWGIVLDAQLVGSVAMTGGELGYTVDPAFWGRGIMTQAACHAVDHAFATYDWPLVRAVTWQDNAGSVRVLRKLGFAHWQSRFEHAKARGIPTLSYHLRLSRDAWHGLRTAEQ